MTDLFFKLFNGEIGQVVEEKVWDEENCWILFRGDEYELMEYSNGIEEWIEEMNVDLDKLIMIKEDGYYRGEGCYVGYYFDENGRTFLLDVMNEFVVDEICKVE